VLLAHMHAIRSVTMQGRVGARPRAVAAQRRVGSYDQDHELRFTDRCMLKLFESPYWLELLFKNGIFLSQYFNINISIN